MNEGGVVVSGCGGRGGARARGGGGRRTRDGDDGAVVEDGDRHERDDGKGEVGGRVRVARHVAVGADSEPVRVRVMGYGCV